MLHRSSIINKIVINIMIIEVMGKTKSPPSFVDSRPRDVIARVRSLACNIEAVKHGGRPTFFFFSSHYTTPAQCWAQDLARGLNSSRSSWVHGCGRMGQTSRCFMVCSFPHSHVVCPSSLNPHFCIMDLHRPVPVRRRFRLEQVGHVSLEPGGSDSFGLNESWCGVVWRWLDQIVSLRVWALPSRGSTEWRKLCLDFSLFLAGSCSYRGCRGSFSCLSLSSWDETAV